MKIEVNVPSNFLRKPKRKEKEFKEAIGLFFHLSQAQKRLVLKDMRKLIAKNINVKFTKENKC